jgi:hypothetical protein
MLPKVTFDVKLFIDSDDINRSRKGLLAMMHALMYVNLTWLETHPRTPLLYNSGVRYKPENGTEFWQDIPRTLELGYGDCEDLACWRAAELNYSGVKARPYIKWRESGPKKSMFHAVIQLPDGRIEDPSSALGMNDLPIIARPVYVEPGPMP